MSFGPTHWCQPLATMHHVGSEEMSLFWEFEMQRHLGSNNASQQGPVLLRDMYTEYFLPRMTDLRDDWNNVSKDVVYLGREPNDDEKGKAVPEEKKSEVGKKAHASVEDCRAACEEMPECFQYQFAHEGKCSLSKSFKIGYPAKRDEDVAKRQTSGWLTGRIAAWVEEQGECAEAKWPEIKSKGFLSFGR